MRTDLFAKPLTDARQEAEAQEYARNFNCSIEIARRDVWDEYHATPIDTDAFYDRQEEAAEYRATGGDAHGDTYYADHDRS